MVSTNICCSPACNLEGVRSILRVSTLVSPCPAAQGRLAKSCFSAVLQQAVIIGGLYYYKGFKQPLLVSGVMGLMALLEDPLFAIYVMGSEAKGKLQRPFKKAGPLDAYVLCHLNVGSPPPRMLQQLGSTTARKAEHTTDAAEKSNWR
jgi:Phosphate transport (Pho88)